MPELPEVETARRLIADEALHRRIADVDDSDTFVCRPHSPGELRAALAGRELTGARRRGKTMWCETSESGPELGIHLGMGGRIVVRSADGQVAWGGEPFRRDAQPPKAEWDRFTLTFADGGRLALFDKRRLGRVRLNPDIDALGPDAAEVTREEFRELITRGSVAVKARLLDQSAIAGVGNLLADEILWRAKVPPATRTGTLRRADADRLYRALEAALDSAIAQGGVHTGEVIAARHPGGTCPRCGAEMHHGTVGGRSTWWCSREQGLQEPVRGHEPTPVRYKRSLIPNGPGSLPRSEEVRSVLDDDAVADAARRLLAAERSREPIRQLSLQYPEMTVEDAYRVQRALVAAKIAEGRTVRARKIGLTSRAMQQAVSITEPDHGVIFDDMVFADGGTVPFGRFIRPRVEVELAFVLGQPLKGPAVTALDVLDATRWVTPALEILDARVQMSDPETGHLRTIVDTIADNAAGAGIVTGGRAVRPDACDLRRVAAVLYVNEAIEETGVAAGVLGHPANGVAWLANTLAPHDEFLPAGQVIMAGSFTRPVFVGAGDVIHADFGDLGAVTCRFR